VSLNKLKANIDKLPDNIPLNKLDTKDISLSKKVLNDLKTQSVEGTEPSYLKRY